jgi:hypothetical protein
LLVTNSVVIIDAEMFREGTAVKNNRVIWLDAIENLQAIQYLPENWSKGALTTCLKSMACTAM